MNISGRAKTDQTKLNQLNSILAHNVIKTTRKQNVPCHSVFFNISFSSYKLTSLSKLIKFTDYDSQVRILKRAVFVHVNCLVSLLNAKLSITYLLGI